MDVYGAAKGRYAAWQVDTEEALARLKATPISIHCWQGDDVRGFDGGGLSGGIQATGDYPGRARNFEELTADFKTACSLIPGKKRINLHASYAVFVGGARVDRDAIAYEHFAPWVDFAREMGIGVDFNPTCFGHKNVKDNLTLSSPDEATRRFWIEHCKRCRRVASEMGRRLDITVLNNLWIPDGMKDAPADRLSPRLRLKSSLDEIFEERLPNLVDSVEGKVFGIGLESYTVGSHEFYAAYTAARQGVYNLLDSGHFHPTENTADKISALLCRFDKIPLHLTRAVRWDSDHTALFDDATREICAELVRADALEKALIGLDFFDASVNRVAAWVVGARGVQKALLYALLTPHARLKAWQDGGDFTRLLVMNEELKTLPFGAVWEEYLRRQGMPEDWFGAALAYEAETLAGRA